MNLFTKYKRKLFSFVLAFTIFFIILNTINMYKENKLLFTIFKTNSYNVENSEILNDKMLQIYSKIVIISF